MRLFFPQCLFQCNCIIVVDGTELEDFVRIFRGHWKHLNRWCDFNQFSLIFRRLRPSSFNSYGRPFQHIHVTVEFRFFLSFFFLIRYNVVHCVDGGRYTAAWLKSWILFGFIHRATSTSISFMKTTSIQKLFIMCNQSMIEAVFTNWRNAAPERFFSRFVFFCTGLSEDAKEEEEKQPHKVCVWVKQSHGVNRLEPSKSSG